NHPSVALSLHNLAVLYQAQGSFAAAEPLYRRSLAIREKALGPGHPDVANTLNNLAALYYAQSDWQRASDYFRRGSAVVAERTRRGSQIVGQRLTGRTKSETVRSSRAFRVFVKSAYRLLRHRDADADKITSEMFKAAQWSTSSEAAGSLAKMAARNAKGSGPLASLVRERQDLVDEWQRRDAWRTAAVSKPPTQRSPEQEAKNTARLTAIDKRIAEIDVRLKAEFPDYAALANPEPLSIAQVQAQLRPDEALVLFLDTPAWKPTPEETFIWVVTKTASRWVRSDAGPTALRQHVDALRCGLDVAAWSKPLCAKLLGVSYRGEDDWKSGKLPPFQIERAHALYQALFGQVEDLIKGKHLLIVPSGPLTQLPFQVLVTKKPPADAVNRTAFLKASWLAKHHAITVLPSASSLQALRAHAKPSRATKPFIGFGNPLLDGDADDPKQLAAARLARTITGCAAPGTMRTASLRGMHRAIKPLRGGARTVEPLEIRAQAPLPETADELCAVARGAGTNTDALYLGKRATETAIKDLSANGILASYRVLHFSTHGALAGELTTSREPGLILTPPQTPTEKDDGYLSASDVAGLKLDADWVILSACNTAAGEQPGAEALSGLASSFFFAGARALLVSHWRVYSDAAVTLTTGTFDAITRRRGIRRAEALRQAMLAMIDGSRVADAHPARWAPFVLIGDGR
ncbi:MAG: CHAT domain-containing protein, partial [Hyphomicrobiaceae bacterium]|nr:CHAT domain-containing protein [Hyphomicrobiaceae bacterium]